MKLLLILALSSYLISGFLLLFSKRNSNSCGWVCLAGSLVAAITGMIPVVYVLAGREPVDINIDWNLPLGSFHLHLDMLSAWFSIPVLLVSVLAGWYGIGYMRHYGDQFNTKFNWFFLQILTGGMFLVLTAWDGVLFLIAWEIMSFAAWFLVMFDHQKHEVRKAGWVYLAATHLGTAFLFAMFIICNNDSGSFNFSNLAGVSVSANIIFLLAVVGFGSKAGFFGFHVWLPEAHPAAPSHVSGLMSGVMIKMGIYGILRILTLVSPWSHWWGWMLIAIGICSGLGGVLYALVQHDIKRLLAYSSVENIGIICLGIGIGVLGVQYNNPLAILGIAGGLVHVINHSVFKTALFMSAGSIANAAGTREIDSLGGLGRKMPVTALVFLAGSVAICGLPPLNGFVSELLIYISSYKSAVFSSDSQSNDLLFAGFTVVSALALIGGLAAMCFAKVFSVVFLGNHRNSCCENAKESSLNMCLPMIVLAGSCIILGIGGFILIRVVAPVAASIHPLNTSVNITYVSMEELIKTSHVLSYISALAVGLMALGLILWILRSYLLKKRQVGQGPTWGCGFQYPTNRMQYTGSSFVQPLLYAFRSLFNTDKNGELIQSEFPNTSSFSTHMHDLFMKCFYCPLFSATSAVFARLRIIQHGRLHLYIFYIILTLAGILVWSII